MEGVGVLVAIAAVGVGLATGLAQARKVGRVWAEAARELGLIQVEDRGILGPSLSAATADGLRVRANRGRRRDTSKTKLQVSAPALLPETLELRRESLATAFEKRFDHPDFETGDPTFDDAVFVRGHPSLIAALLDVRTRDDVLRLLRAGGWVAHGEAALETRRRLFKGEEFLDELGRLVDLTRRLCSPRDPAALLAANAREDPVPGVRLRNLELLADRFRDRPETAETLRAALADPGAAVRLAAALRLGPEGHPALEGLALARDTPEPIAADAVRALGPAFGVERAAELLDRARRDHRRALSLAALEALGRAGDPRAAERLTPLLAEADGELAATAVRSLVATGDPRAPSALVAALEHRSRVVRLAATAALGQVGSVEAVPALRAAVAAHPADLGLRSAVADAVAAIQERATGAAPGQLALAEGQAGELALAGAGGGGDLALADELTTAHELAPGTQE